MKNIKKLIPLLILAFCLAPTIAMASQPTTRAVPPAKFRPLTGQVPSFNFQTIEGEDFSLSPYLGQKVLIVNFWATWCPPCVKEMPSIDQLAATLPANKFKVMVIAVQNEKAEVSGFFKRANLKNLTPYMDPQMQGPRAFGLAGMPSTIIIGPNGLIGRVDGELDWAAPEVVSWLESLG